MYFSKKGNYLWAMFMIDYRVNDSLQS